ncbi:MAG: nitronate monooxygenase [Deltaproteobacteria bacterium]|nr:nitronate monooxygenase [Deltaproteobacteria bacterium]
MYIEKLMKKGADFLGSKYPVMCGAMTWVSDAKLVSAVGDAGGFGLLAGGNAPVEIFRDEIIKTTEMSTNPFGVNLITVAPNYKDQLAMVCEMKPEVVVFAGSFPRAPEIKKVKDIGSKVICFAPTEALALKLIAQGADALILEGSEAGGHIGPVSLTVLLQQLLFKIDTIPIFVAGGIATGKMMAHMLTMGAAGVQMGTRFVMSEECTAHYNFKEQFIRARARDATATPQFDSRLPVIPVRALKNDGTAVFGKLQLDLIRKLESGEINRNQAQHEVERFWMGALKNAVIDGDVTNGSLMAGQSVGLMDEIMPLKDIFNELLEDGEKALESIKKMICD